MKNLSLKERKFLLAHIQGVSLTDGYLSLKPGMKRDTASVLGSRMMRRIVKKVGFAQLAEGANLSDVRLFVELEARLHEDIPSVRMQGTELLARLLGRLKGDLNVHLDAVEIIPAPRPPELQGDDVEPAEGSQV